MIKDWLQNYIPKTQNDYTLALREIMQQIALAGLYRGGFFEKAAFYGGTALRIFYGLQRFSEAEFRRLLNNRIDNVNMEMVKADISRFIPDPVVLEIWSKTYFHDLVNLMKIKNETI